MSKLSVYHDGSGFLCSGIGREEMKIDNVTNTIANALEAACGLDVTPNALEAIQLALDSCSMTPAKERDLEIWRQAYNAALSCSNVCNTEACDCANSALIDYRAKREEMCK